MLNDSDRQPAINQTPASIRCGRCLAGFVAALALVLVTACGGSIAATHGSPAPSVAASPTPPPIQSPTPSIAASGGNPTLYVFSPEAGSTVGGTAGLAREANAVKLTVSAVGLTPGEDYIADADPLPCLLFTGGPSQAFPQPFKADASGKATVVWTVPNGMAGSASIQALMNGSFVVLACADLH